MAISKMSRARIAVHKSVATNLTSELQKLAVCEFIKSSYENSSESTVDLVNIKDKLQKLKSIFKILEPYETTKPDSFAMMMGEIPQETLAHLKVLSAELDFDGIYSDTLQADRNLKASYAELLNLQTMEQQLLKFINIPYPLEIFISGTGLTKGFIYEVSKIRSQEFVAAVQTGLDKLCECTLINGDKKSSTDMLVVIAPITKEGILRDTANNFSAFTVGVESWMRESASDELTKLKRKIISVEREIHSIEGTVVLLADNNLPKLRKVFDYYSILHERESVREAAQPTEKVLVWDLWILSSALDKVNKIVRNFGDKVALQIVEPEEGELPPTFLSNPNWSNCMEPLTMMYGAPTYGTPDPCSVMAPFFFLILGICFGDAGYGLLLSGVVGYFLIRHNMPPLLRKFFIILLVGLFSSFVVGLVTGTFFGDALTAFSFLAPVTAHLQKIQLLDPMNDPMTFLGISLAIGVLQIVAGLAIAMVHAWKNGEKFSAIFDQGAWITFLLGLVGLGVFSGLVNLPLYATVCKYVAIASAVALVLTQGREKKNIFVKLFSGILSLYNITGYFGDVLSYSRLLALGLSGAAVGMVINLLVNMVLPIKYVGWLLAILIFVLGHGFSIAVNILGAFVHDLRLQFVEFFGKFYEAGGREFMPLSIKTKFLKIKA
ncbi:MAG: V-type ATP synthase subunit I [Synergistaceae bacterium]|nr:V-type ATP synthase subunit I [Synergistaceae bacterium]